MSQCAWARDDSGLASRAHAIPKAMPLQRGSSPRRRRPRVQLAAVLLDLGLALRRIAVRLRVDLALPGPQTASRKCVGPSLNEACMARPSMVVPNTDFQKYRLKPFSKRLAARSVRVATEGSPSTTATRRRPSRVAEATMLKPESQMKPVFMPSAPWNETSNRLWVRISFLPT